HVWALMGWGYALGLAYAVGRAQRRPGPDDSTAAGAAVVAATCLFGLGEFAYFVARSTTPLLMFVAWPLAILALWALDHALTERASGHGAVRVAMLVVTSGVLIVMCGVFADRFLRPPDPTASNSTLLRVMLAGRPWLAEMRERLADTQPFPAP